MSIEFPVQANLRPFEKDVENAKGRASKDLQRVADVAERDHDRQQTRHERENERQRTKQEQKWIFSRRTMEIEFERARQQAEISFMFTLRMMWSQVNQVWSVLDQMLGVGQNMVYRLVSFVVSAFTSLIAQAYMMAKLYGLNPLTAPLAVLAMGTAVMGTAMQGNAILQMQMIEQHTGNIGDIIAGVDF